jgi:Holliday junction resolvase RusA-like endonuclease
MRRNGTMEARAALTVLETSPPPVDAGHAPMPLPSARNLVVNGLEILGTPEGQGSKTVASHTNAAGKTRSWVREQNRDLAPFRGRVVQTARDYWQDRPPLDRPLMVSIVFAFLRPGSHFSRGRTTWGRLLPSAPGECVTTGDDIDKLQRALFDSLTIAGLIRDDKLIVRLRDVYRRYDDHEYVRIWLWELPR